MEKRFYMKDLKCFLNFRNVFKLAMYHITYFLFFTALALLIFINLTDFLIEVISCWMFTIVEDSSV